VVGLRSLVAGSVAVAAVAAGRVGGSWDGVCGFGWFPAEAGRREVGCFAMAISREEVEKVALLGRLRLSPDELDVMTTQLDAILQYMSLLQQVDTDGVEPMAHAMDVSDVFRPDVVLASLPREQALANAPQHDTECYRVPAVLGDA
jgi:aspartyl-tRNA(Asn)/glutamyl-tRNA(Gln) amidotransferase subunit C